MANENERIAQAIQQANDRLKSGKAGVQVYQKGGRLVLRGTFPPKPHLQQKHPKPYQQWLSLYLPATLAGVAEAERRAKLIGAELGLGKFNWADWIDEPEKRETAGEWVKRFEANYWAKRKRTQQSETTWATDYLAVFKKLPAGEPLTADLLVELAIATEPDSRSRKRYCEVLARLAKFAGLERQELDELKGDYSHRSVKPRELPSDEEIEACRDRVKSEGWRWVFGILAAYGLRPHEVFSCDLTDFPKLRVAEETKTSARFVFPLYPDWAEEWQIGYRCLPNLHGIGELSNADLGAKIGGYFYDAKIGFPPYHLRHCYARRCFEFGLSPDYGAKMMGHAVDTHCKTYRAWIDEDVYQRIYDTALANPNRPRRSKTK